MRSDSSGPLVSVVVPTRDRPAELQRALSAALAQRDVTTEVIVVDDGSRVPVELAGMPVEVVRLAASRGVAHARNQGVARASGRWVAFLDDDDLWAPDRLAKLLATVGSTGADVVLSATIALDGAGRPLRVHPLPDVSRLRQELWKENVVGGPSSVMVDRGVLDRVGGFDETFGVLADWELWMRLTSVASFAICHDVLTGYVMHDDNMHVTRTNAAVEEFARLVARYGVARRPGQPGMHDEAFVRWAAGVHRRAGRRRAAARLYLRNWRRHRRPADLARALAMPLGERVMRRLNPRPPLPTPRAPDWVSLYVGSGGLRPLAS